MPTWALLNMLAQSHAYNLLIVPNTNHSWVSFSLTLHKQPMVGIGPSQQPRDYIIESYA